MKFDFEALLREIAHRKHRAATVRATGVRPGTERSLTVYQEACAAIAASLAPLGFRFAKSGPHATRRAGEFVHRVGFQSSRNNVAGEYVSIAVFANLGCPRWLAWWRRFEPTATRAYLAGGQIGNLVPNAAWLEWNLADGGTRDAVIAEIISAIQALALPYLERFETPAATRAMLWQELPPSLWIHRAIEFALAFDDRPLAQHLLERDLRRSSERPAEYHRWLEKFRQTGVPRWSEAGSARDLAKATLLYGLDPGV
jgi:hypothetical protein